MKAEIVNKHRDIIEESKKGSQIAMYQLYQNYSRAMYNICYRMMNSREEAEDMLQDAFTDTFAKLKSFRYESTFGAWMKQIVVNKCINAIKKRKIDVQFEEEIEKFDQIDDDHGVSEFDLQLDVSKIRLAIGSLPDGYRVIFSLFALEGYDHKEISEILKISESTSKSQYMRAKRKIIEIIKSQGYER